MSKQKLVYLIWLLPAWLLFLTGHQILVYYSMGQTYAEGESYSAEITDFDIKQIAAQTNGYVVLRFDTDEGETIREHLSLPVEVVSLIQDMGTIPVRYKEDAYEDIVMMPTYEVHSKLVLSNIGLSGVGFLITLFIALTVHRYTSQKLRHPPQEIVIERID